MMMDRTTTATVGTGGVVCLQLEACGGFGLFDVA